MNEPIAAQLDDLADLLEAQEANLHRVAAYRHAAAVLRGLGEPVAALLSRGGEEALRELPGIGKSLARTIAQLARTGRLGMLARLRGETPSEALLRLIPAIGPRLAARIHDELGIETADELAQAVATGRLARLKGIGPKRRRALESFLAARPLRRSEESREPRVDVLLSIDAEYRRRAAAGELPRITPARLNPERRAWLPILHTERDGHHYTALFSNTARAHELDKTHDWVVIYLDDDGGGRWTVVTETHGVLSGRRVVRGREHECRARLAAAAVEAHLA